MNLSGTFDPVSYAEEVEGAARAVGWTVHHLSPMESGPRPWFQRASTDGDSAPPRLYLSAGIHGDEISGPLALLEMIRQPILSTPSM
jgi:predicted deacylase